VNLLSVTAPKYESPRLMLKRRHRVTVYAKDSHAKVSKQGGSSRSRPQTATRLEPLPYRPYESSSARNWPNV